MGIRNEHKGRLMTIEEAIQALKKEKRTALHENKVAFDMAIKALEQEPRWISVSERLPKNKETVLVTFKHFVSGNIIGLGSVILLQGKPHWHVREQNLGTYDVIAWMPLPKPYKPQESEG